MVEQVTKHGSWFLGAQVLGCDADLISFLLTKTDLLWRGGPDLLRWWYNGPAVGAARMTSNGSVISLTAMVADTCCSSTVVRMHKTREAGGRRLSRYTLVVYGLSNLLRLDTEMVVLMSRQMGARSRMSV